MSQDRRAFIFRVIPILIALPAVLIAAKEPALKKLWQIRVTQEYAGAPLKSVIPVSLWALAFSPDGSSLAFAAGFIESKKASLPLGVRIVPPFRTYLFIVDTRQPAAAKKRFELQMPPYLNQPKMIWSTNADSIALQSVSLLEGEHEVHLVRTSDGAERTIDIGRCNLVGVFSEFRLIADCWNTKDGKAYLRFFTADGNVEREVGIPGIGSIKAIDVNSGRLLLDHARVPDPGELGDPHEIALAGLDGKELRRWTLPAAHWYDGAFADSGKRFCIVSRRVPDRSPKKQALNCFSVSTGEQLSQQTLAYLPHPDDIRAGGLLIGVPEGDNPYLFASRRVLYDLQTGKKITGWTLQTQRLLPKPFSRVGFYPFDIAPDGKVVAEGGEGVVTLYQLP